MLRPIFSFLLLGSLLMAADEPDYKSQVDVNLGTWDLGYNRYLTDRFSLRIKAGWQDDRTTGELTSDQWNDPDSLNPITRSEETSAVNKLNLNLELTGLVRLVETNDVDLVAGAGYRIGRSLSTSKVHRDFTIPYFDNAIITGTQDYNGEMLTTYHGPVGVIQLRHQISSRLEFFAELNYRLEWHREQFESLHDEESDYHYYHRTVWDETDTVAGFEKLKVGLSIQF